MSFFELGYWLSITPGEEDDKIGLIHLLKKAQQIIGCNTNKFIPTLRMMFMHSVVDRPTGKLGFSK